MSASDEIGIGERLRFYRQGRGKTQAVIAGLAGVSEDYVSQIERGAKTPTIGLLHKFARIQVFRCRCCSGNRSLSRTARFTRWRRSCIDG